MTETTPRGSIIVTGYEPGIPNPDPSNPGYAPSGHADYIKGQIDGANSAHMATQEAAQAGAVEQWRQKLGALTAGPEGETFEQAVERLAREFASTDAAQAEYAAIRTARPSVLRRALAVGRTVAQAGVERGRQMWGSERAARMRQVAGTVARTAIIGLADPNLQRSLGVYADAATQSPTVRGRHRTSATAGDQPAGAPSVPSVANEAPVTVDTNNAPADAAEPEPVSPVSPDLRPAPAPRQSPTADVIPVAAQRPAEVNPVAVIDGQVLEPGDYGLGSGEWSELGPWPALEGVGKMLADLDVSRRAALGDPSATAEIPAVPSSALTGTTVEISEVPLPGGPAAATAPEPPTPTLGAHAPSASTGRRRRWLRDRRSSANGKPPAPVRAAKPPKPKDDPNIGYWQQMVYGPGGNKRKRSPRTANAA